MKTVKMNTVKRIAFDGVGIALYVVISMFLSFPIVQNWYLSLGYVVMVLYLYAMGIVDGMIIGVAGTALCCLLVNMVWGIPGWIVGNIIICVMVGLCLRSAGNITDWHVKNYIMVSAGMILSSIVGILLVKSFMEIFYYGQPFVVRLSRNFGGCIMDMIGLLLAIPVMKLCGNKLREMQR